MRADLSHRQIIIMLGDQGSLKIQNKSTQRRRTVWRRLTTLDMSSLVINLAQILTATPTGKRALKIRICRSKNTCRQLMLNLGKRDTNRQCRIDLQEITLVAKTMSSKVYCRSTTISNHNKRPEIQWDLWWVLLGMPKQTNCHYPV